MDTALSAVLGDCFAVEGRHSVVGKTVQETWVGNAVEKMVLGCIVAWKCIGIVEPLAVFEKATVVC